MEQLNTLKDNADGYVRKSTEMMTEPTSDLSKDPSSKGVQQIVAKLINAVNETNEFVKNVDFGDNYWGLMSELYLSNPAYIEVTDRQYGNGASKFIGEALKFYCENMSNAEKM